MIAQGFMEDSGLNRTAFTHIYMHMTPFRLGLRFNLVKFGEKLQFAWLKSAPFHH